MAREEIWIIADSDNADKTLKLHQLKNLAVSDIRIEKWYLFSAFDIVTQTAKPIGNAFQQIENGLLKTMGERPRLPHSVIVLLGDSFLDDRKLHLNKNYLFDVLHHLFRQLKRQIDKLTELLPQKARPIKEVQFFITKPLPKPERYFKGRLHIFQKLAKTRHAYNDQFIKALRGAGMSFINPGISSKDGHYFTKVTASWGKEKFILTPDGLAAYWESISKSLHTLHETKQPTAPGNQVHCATAQSNTTKTSDYDSDIEEYFTCKTY